MIKHRLFYCVAPFPGICYEIKNVKISHSLGMEFSSYDSHVRYFWERPNIPKNLAEYRRARKELMNMKLYIETNHGKTSRV
ncbi:hypothetical protein [Leptospira phage LE4]|uniref:Uncharacterized protein n=1 Tax=Leptospira phage LE4 TaxID=2041383 RepID=A0A343LEF9_9CAUD|nr:hypothetical protein HWB34_gp56 [Leptospira phage LE4]ATN95069.1 hypothetical protein [Leptospira phage LE4]